VVSSASFRATCVWEVAESSRNFERTDGARQFNEEGSSSRTNEFRPFRRLNCSKVARGWTRDRTAKFSGRARMTRSRADEYRDDLDDLNENWMRKVDDPCCKYHKKCNI